MLSSKVFLQLLVIEIILWIATAVPPITDMTSLMLLTAVIIELVVTVESLPTEATLWMTFEARLIDRSWIIVTVPFVLSQFAKREQFVLMSEDFFVPRAQIAHRFSMLRSYMTVQIWPSQASCITILVRTIVSEQQDRIFENFVLLVLDTKVRVNLHKFRIIKLLKALVWRVSEHNKWGFCLVTVSNEIPRGFPGELTLQ